MACYRMPVDCEMASRSRSERMVVVSNNQTDSTTVTRQFASQNLAERDEGLLRTQVTTSARLCRMVDSIRDIHPLSVSTGPPIARQNPAAGEGICFNLP